MPSKALLVPANRFELLECRAAVDAVGARELDGDSPRPGALDVLVQHVTGVACSAPFAAAALYDEVRRDRKSVVWGKSVSVRVDLGGRGSIKKIISHTQHI